MHGMRSQNIILLQVISSSPRDSSIIQANGGDRIELVSALQIGGVTPSGSIVRRSLQAASIPTHVIVRHHNNGFVHSKEETSLLIEDIVQLRDRFKVHGVVVGGLEKHGDEYLVDTRLMQLVTIECGGKTKVTFHKASDQTSNLHTAVKTLTEMGVDQILTQGGKEGALSLANIQAIRDIPKQLRSAKILAGGGISHANVKPVIHEWEINRVHIGTCVRKNKYEAVDAQMLLDFRKIIDDLA